MRRKPRRIVAGILVVLGALLLLLAPQASIAGGVLALLGVLIEIVGITLERRRVDEEE